MEKRWDISGKTIELLGDNKSELILLLTDHGEKEEIQKALSESMTELPMIASVSGFDWNRDLSPWKAEAVFKNGEVFLGGADEFIEELETKILPGILEKIDQNPERISIGGYSLAGLFSLYCGYRSDRFQGIICGSASLWYPGFSEYTDSHNLMPEVKRVYFSMGDKEALTKNPIMKTVEDRTRHIEKQLSEQGIQTIFEENAGNHFVNVGPRMAKGIRWILEGNSGL